MRTRGNQLLIQILLMIIITVIVAYTCMNLAELVNMYSEAIGKAITQINVFSLKFPIFEFILDFELC